MHTGIIQEKDTEEYRSGFQQEKEINDFILNEFSSSLTYDGHFKKLDSKPFPGKGRQFSLFEGSAETTIF